MPPFYHYRTFGNFGLFAAYGVAVRPAGWPCAFFLTEAEAADYCATMNADALNLMLAPFLCPRCCGTGEITEPHPSGYPNTTVYADCPSCTNGLAASSHRPAPADALDIPF
jgi:hypothetical protein